ncbi:MAG: hypothetical protein Tsb0015_13450 [Simkaniaceae bacterium]
MTNALNAVCEKLIKDNPGNDDWIKQIQSLYEGRDLPIQALISLQKKEKDLSHPLVYVSEAKNLLCVALLLHLSQAEAKALDPFYNSLKVFSEHFYSTILFPSTVLMLSHRLLNLPVSKKQRLNLEKWPEGEFPYMDASVPSQVKSLEMGLLTLALGIIDWDVDRISKGISIGYRHLHLFDSENEPLLSLWLKEEEYIYEDLLAKYYLFFQGLAFLTKDADFINASESLFTRFSQLSKEEYTNISPFVILLMIYFNKYLDRQKKIQVSFPDKKEELLIKKSSKDFSLALTTIGINTGLGSIKKGKISIENFGPHFFPLGEIQNFGIFHLPEWKEDNEVQSEDPFHFKGWTTLISPFKANASQAYLEKFRRGDIAMELDVKQSSEAVDISTRFLGPMESSKLAFTFFIKAEKIEVSENIFLLPLSLDRYQGKNNKIKIISSNEFFYIEPSFSGEMQIFPLAGKNHFWGSNFLIAYSVIDEDKKYSWFLSY